MRLHSILLHTVELIHILNQVPLIILECWVISMELQSKSSILQSLLKVPWLNVQANFLAIFKVSWLHSGWDGVLSCLLIFLGNCWRIILQIPSFKYCSRGQKYQSILKLIWRPMAPHGWVNVYLRVKCCLK